HILARKIAPDTAGPRVDFLCLVAAIRLRNHARREALCRRPERQPVPDVAHPPVQKRRKGVSHALRRLHLEPALPAFAAILRAGKSNALVTCRAFSEAYAREHQQFAVLLSEREERALHRLDFELWRTPAKAVLRSGHTASEEIHKEPIIQCRQHHLRVNTTLL